MLFHTNLTLQTIKGGSFEVAGQLLRDLIADLYDERRYLLKSEALSSQEKTYFRRVQCGVDENGDRVTTADYLKALRNLTEFLRKESGKKVVVLIDEYDVPLEKAYQDGYYPEMINLIGPMLQNVLKTNSENLQFAVVTGCLRIAKEGIYTGLNNPAINTVLSNYGSDAIGFTEEETRKLLEDSGVGEYFEQVREWYDGYHFGNTTM